MGIWFIILAAAGTWLLTGRQQQPSMPLPQTNGFVYTLPDGFDTALLNSQMRISHGFRFSSAQPLARLVPAIRQSFRPNPDPMAILHGNAAHVPVGWAYVELRNMGPAPRYLVLSMPQYRCTQASVWVGRAGYFSLVGTLRNTSPLGDRFYPFLNYAFPITIPPRTTLPLLLRTQSYASYHEVDVRLSQKRFYAELAYTGSIRDGAQVLIFLMLAAVSLLIGWLSQSRLLRWFGFALLSFSIMCASHAGLFSRLPYPAGLALNADTIGTFCRLLINIMVHPFFYVLVEPAVRNKRRYKTVIAVCCGLNLLLMGLHLLPLPYYDALNYGINIGMVSLSLVNIGWLLIWGGLAAYRAQIWSPLIIALLGAGPLLLGHLIALIQGQHDTYRQSPPSPAYIVLLLSYLTYDQLRKELVTRQRMQNQVRALGDYNETLRREEITNIGRDLHDQVGNTQATALSYLGHPLINHDKLRQILLTAIRELRFLSHNLVQDDDRPLSSKIDGLVSRFNDFTTIQLTFMDYTQQQIDRLPPLTQQSLYRIIQELLTNVIRHSGATQASVQFFCEGEQIDISVEDDGAGFDLVGDATKGIGIQTIYKRAALSGIDVRFDPAPSGTTVLLQTTTSSRTPPN